MVHMFDDIQKQMQERWEKIDKLVEQLQDKTKSVQPRIDNMEQLLLLLVEQIKPMSTVDSAEFDEGMKKILDAFTGGKDGK